MQITNSTLSLPNLYQKSVWAMRHSEKTVLSYRFTLQHSQKALKYGRIPSFFAVVARQIGYGQNCFAP